MLTIHHSNSLETLAGRLADRLSGSLEDLFQPEVIVVPNPGMARWIAHELSQRNSICANTEFPLPASFFWQVLVAWKPLADASSLSDKEILLWRIQGLLSELIGTQPFSPLDGYLAQGDSDSKSLQLSGRIADLFDQYLVFRPEMLLAWEKGEEQHWQAILWRRLFAAEEHSHRAKLLDQLLRSMNQSSPTPGMLPQRIFLFALSALAPVYMQILGGLAQHLELHLFYLNPCQEYWADLVDEHGMAYRRAAARRAGLADPTGLLDVGNPLLASLGHAGQVFLDQLLELEAEHCDQFVVPVGKTLLRQLQLDVLELTDARQQSPNRVFADDQSLQLHSTHTRLREVQVLRDRLLRMFDDLDGLEPRQIIVMAPDIDLYAPYIEAVFADSADQTSIPWSIADRRLGSEQPLLQAFMTLLQLPRSRLPASELLSLLQVPAIGRCFQLDEEGLDRVRGWVHESGIRWGGDAAMRAGLQLPEEDANTWSFGLKRLFLGYAMPADADAQPFEEVLPYVDLEGSDLQYLGALQTFVQRLNRWREHLSSSHTLVEWRKWINQLLSDFFMAGENEQGVIQQLRNHMDELVRHSGEADFNEAVSVDVIRLLLKPVVEDTQAGLRFATGGVTFCNMLPMRSIPFRVVCLMGMNGTDFPRDQARLSFDLMAQRPRRGDRCRRRDDRYLFLEALLSAADVFYMSYIGNDVRDNSVKVPSVVVSELLDYLDQGYSVPEAELVSDQLVIHHPLQPFSQRYFDKQDERLFSYARHWLDAARTQTDEQIPPFIEEQLGAPDEALRVLDMEDLIRFLINPARAFLIQRLYLRIAGDDELTNDAEPFDAEGLERYQLRQSLLARMLTGKHHSQVQRCLRGEGILPHGMPGDLLLQEQIEVAEPFLKRVGKRDGESLKPLQLDLELAEYRLQGSLRNLYDHGLVVYRLGKLRAKDQLDIWVRHLLLNALRPTGVESVSQYIAEDCTLSLQPVENPQTFLLELLELRWQGLTMPLPFFPESALAWLQKETYSTGFHNAWSGDWNYSPEQDDAAVRIAFRGSDPIGVEFERLAKAILLPMLEHAEIIKAKDDL